MGVLDPGVEVGRGEPVAEAERPVRAPETRVGGANQAAHGDQDEGRHGSGDRQLGESSHIGFLSPLISGRASGRGHDSRRVPRTGRGAPIGAALASTCMSDGRLLHLNVSGGGVPKLPVDAARITTYGVEGDRQASDTVHGGPHRAVSILGIEAIRRVAAEGHPIGPGTTGENLTTEGFDVSALPVGTRLIIGEEVVLEISQPTNPCRTIRHSFADLRFGRLSMMAHPADSRMYARVLREGTVRPGDAIRLEAPSGDGAQLFGIADRLDGAERESAVAFWRAAVEAGCRVELLDDGEIAASASPTLPGPTFNSAYGFAHLPNLVDRALSHFAAQRDHRLGDRRRPALARSRRRLDAGAVRGRDGRRHAGR